MITRALYWLRAVCGCAVAIALLLTLVVVSWFRRVESDGLDWVEEE